jgi:hypothetical protein
VVPNWQVDPGVGAGGHIDNFSYTALYNQAGSQASCPASCNWHAWCCVSMTVVGYVEHKKSGRRHAACRERECPSHCPALDNPPTGVELIAWPPVHGPHIGGMVA